MMENKKTVRCPKCDYFLDLMGALFTNDLLDDSYETLIRCPSCESLVTIATEAVYNFSVVKSE
jgi:DNA-directed RNA polymerase subunit RPC12/RpoP